MSALRTASHLAVLAAFTAVAAIPNARADDCDKNHYILDDPRCAISAKEEAIGPPGAVVVDGAGGFYFSSPNIVFHVDRNGHLKRVAGNGSAGFAGDGGPALNALLNFPRSYPELEQDPTSYSELLGPLAVDRAGNLYIGDAYNNRVRRVSASGVISTLAGNGDRGEYGVSADANGTWSTKDDIEDGGQATAAPITWPSGIAVGEDGTIFVTSNFGWFFRITAQGIISTILTHDCGWSQRDLGLCAPHGIALHPSGDILAADVCRIRKVRLDGNVFTIAGAEIVRTEHWNVFTCGYAGDGGPALHARMGGPFAVTADTHGNIFIADTYNHCIRRVDAAGVISTFAGVCRRAGASGDLGLATEATLLRPHGVAVDTAGNVYIADTGNFRIRKVSPDGIITTVAGNGSDFPGAPTCRWVGGNWVCR